MKGLALERRCPAFVLFLAATVGPWASDAIGLRPADKSRTAALSQLDGLIADTSEALGMGAFSFLIGDEDGIRYARSINDGTSVFHDGSNPRTPFPVFSAGKWLVAAALGAAVQAGDLAWDDKVAEHIPWWACRADDRRCHITFRHLLSHTSGLTASSTFLAAVGLESESSTYVGLFNTSYTLEDCAKAVYHGSEGIPKVPAPYRYGETHYLVAQFAAMRATGMATWQDFFSKYLANPLGLHWEVTDSALMSTGRFFATEDAAYTYGFARMDLSTGAFVTGEKIPNPDGGAQLIASACAFSRFLTSYLRQGDSLYGAQNLDKNHTRDGTSGSLEGDGYALGHWLLSAMNLMHSAGHGGTFPAIVTAPTGRKFWIHVQQFKPGDHMSAGQLLAAILPTLLELMAAPPAVNSAVCARL